ncbi:hypothetical protein ACFLX4_00560 [Chloroflexota bacterium]
MPFKDLREFIAKLEKEGEAIQIEEEVDWNMEAGAMLRRSTEEGLPAPFFQKIKDYPEGYRLNLAVVPPNSAGWQSLWICLPIPTPGK